METQTSFPELVRIMVDADMEAAGLPPVGEGVQILQVQFSDWHRWRISKLDVVQSVEGAACERSMPENRLRDFWSGSRVLVTGGAGFLGSRVVEKLRRRQCEEDFCSKKQGL